MSPKEVAAAAIYLKDTLVKEGVQEPISNLSIDKRSAKQIFSFSALTLFILKTRMYFYLTC